MTGYDARAATMDVSAAPGGVEGTPVGSPATPAPISERMARAYEGFLGMPVGVVLALMWVAGAALLGSCALVLYIVGTVLVPWMVGAL